MIIFYIVFQLRLQELILKNNFFRVGPVIKAVVKQHKLSLGAGNSYFLTPLHFPKIRGIVAFALVGLFLGRALQAVRSREERIQESTDGEYNGLERDEEELAYPDEFNDDDGASVDDADRADDENDDGDDLDVDVQPADPFDDDDDDDQNEEELGEYQR